MRFLGVRAAAMMEPLNYAIAVVFCDEDIAQAGV